MQMVRRARTKQEAQKELTDSITAPVDGSWGAPAWTAKVPKLCTGEGALGGVSIETLVVAAGDMTLLLVKPRDGRY